MREILFRGKRCDNLEWVEGYLLKECNYSTCSWNLGIEYKTDKFGKFAYDVAEIIPYTVGQFTGLTDKNGKKIFDGDIIEWFFPEVSEYPSLAYIEYDESSFAWRVCWNKCDPDWLEGMQSQYITVIGNIFDNKDLLS